METDTARARQLWSSAQKLFHEDEILFVWFHRWHETNLLTSGLRLARPKDHEFEQQPQVGESGNDANPLGF